MVIRGTKPESGNKYFNTKSKGGYSTCIVGKPTEKGLNVKRFVNFFVHSKLTSVIICYTFNVS